MAGMDDWDAEAMHKHIAQGHKLLALMEPLVLMHGVIDLQLDDRSEQLLFKASSLANGPHTDLSVLTNQEQLDLARTATFGMVRARLAILNVILEQHEQHGARPFGAGTMELLLDQLRGK